MRARPTVQGASPADVKGQSGASYAAGGLAAAVTAVKGMKIVQVSSICFVRCGVCRGSCAAGQTSQNKSKQVGLFPLRPDEVPGAGWPVLVVVRRAKARAAGGGTRCVYLMAAAAMFAIDYHFKTGTT